MKNSKIIPIILCGGSGTRLWPISRNDYPKQFLNIDGAHSLLQNTVMRTLSITNTDPKDLIVLTLASFAADVREQLNTIGIGAAHIICEPEAKGTAAAITYAALFARKVYGDDALIWILPSDHTIKNSEELGNSLGFAIEAAEKNHLVTFGITPDHPETGYGYIKTSNSPLLTGVNKVEHFVEKPNSATAEEYLKDGSYLWNSGMFLFKASCLLTEVESLATDIFEKTLNAFTSATNKEQPLYKDYTSIPVAAIDTAVMETSKNIAVVPCHAGWSDIGSWESLWKFSDKDLHGNVKRGNVVEHNTQNSLIYAHNNKPIICCGLDNMLVIDSGDVILVADLKQSQEIRSVTQLLTEKGLQNLLGKNKQTS